MTLAFALIKHMLKLENRSKDAYDLGSDFWIASLAVSCARKIEASLPQAPQESTARGVGTHPRAKHFSSFAWCFLLLLFNSYSDRYSETSGIHTIYSQRQYSRNFSYGFFFVTV